MTIRPSLARCRLSRRTMLPTSPTPSPSTKTRPACTVPVSLALFLSISSTEPFSRMNISTARCPRTPRGRRAVSAGGIRRGSGGRTSDARCPASCSDPPGRRARHARRTRAVHHVRARFQQFVDDARHRLFIAGDGVGRDDDRVPAGRPPPFYGRNRPCGRGRTWARPGCPL